MSDVEKIDETLDQLELAVQGLTTSTSLDALRYIHKLGTASGCSRHAAESVKHIADMYAQAEASLMAGINHVKEDRDDIAEDHFGYALVHLDQIAEAVAIVTGEQPARQQPKLTHNKS